MKPRFFLVKAPSNPTMGDHCSANKIYSVFDRAQLEPNPKYDGKFKRHVMVKSGLNFFEANDTLKALNQASP